MMRYRCVQADPNWEERGGGGRGCQEHYHPSSVNQIIDAMKGWLWGDLYDSKRVDESGCHLWMWCTDTFVWNGAAHGVLGAVGFRPVASWIWVKTGTTVVHHRPNFGTTDDGEKAECAVAVGPKVAERMLRTGTGQYGRKCHEHLILATHGNAMVPEPANRPPSVFFAPRPCIPGTRKPMHSAKPDKAYRIIEQVSPGPRLELYARRAVPGWTAIGNEV